MVKQLNSTWCLQKLELYKLHAVQTKSHKFQATLLEICKDFLKDYDKYFKKTPISLWSAQPNAFCIFEYWLQLILLICLMYHDR